MVTAKINHKKSQFTLHYDNLHEDMEDVWLLRNEWFNFTDGHTLTRYQQTEPNREYSFYEMGKLSYNYIDNSRMFNIESGLNHHNLLSGSEGIMSINTKIERNRQQSEHNRNLNPYLDIYYQETLKHGQFIAFNIVGNFITTKKRGSYCESNTDTPLFKYTSDVAGKKYTLIAEGLYEKTFSNSHRFSTGIRHTQAYINNSYTGSLSENTEMRQADSYFFIQYSGNLSKIGFNISAGIYRSRLHQTKQSKYETFTFSPQISINYHLSPCLTSMLTFKGGNSNPTLAQLSAVDQIIDSLQIIRGNPNLAPYKYYASTMRLNYNKSKLNLGFTFRYDFNDHIIMQTIFPENDKFIHTYDNQRNSQNLQVGVDLRYGMLWNILQLRGNITYKKHGAMGITTHILITHWGLISKLYYLINNSLLSAHTTLEMIFL